MGRIKRFVPLLLVELFISMTYLLYRYGAWMYPYRKDNLTLVFVLGCLFTFAIGYIWQDRHRKKYSKGNFLYVKWAKYIAAANVLLMIPYCLCRTGKWFPPLISSMKALNVAYANATMAVGSYEGLHTLVGFGTILIYALYHMTYFYWEELSLKLKVIAIVECVWYISVVLSTGRNKGITVIAIMIIIMYIAKMCESQWRNDKRNILVRTIVTILLLALVPVYFAMSMTHRGEGTKVELEVTDKSVKEMLLGDEESNKMIINNYGYKEPKLKQETTLENKTENNEKKIEITPGLISESIIKRYEKNAPLALSVHPYYADEFSYSYLNIEDPVYCMLPGSVGYFYAIGSYYVGHGYHALSIALRLPFETCYGFGHISILHGLFEKVTGIDLYKKTYVYKVNQSGYPVSLKWGTAFIQWASDISFIGVVFLMGVLGMLVAKLWGEVLIQKNFIALMLLTALAMNLLFITSWWQAGMSGTDFLWFYGSLFAWVLQKIVVVIKKKKNNNIISLGGQDVQG